MLRISEAHRLAGVEHVAQESEALGERATPGEPGLQRLSANQLLRAEQRPVLAPGQLVDGDDARMVETRDQANLAKEPSPGGPGGAVLRGRALGDELLERHLTPDNLIAGGADDALAASAQLSQPGVLPGTLERHVRPGRMRSVCGRRSVELGNECLEQRRPAERARYRADISLPGHQGLLRERLEHLPALAVEHATSLQAGEKRVGSGVVEPRSRGGQALRRRDESRLSREPSDDEIAILHGSLRRTPNRRRTSPELYSVSRIRHQPGGTGFRRGPSSTVQPGR